MAESGETNPKKTTAPGSDNSQGIGGVPPVVLPPAVFDKGMKDILQNQLKAQQEQTDLLEKLADRLKQNQTNIDSAQLKGFNAQKENDIKGLEIAEKELWVALREQESNQNNMGDLGKKIMDLQKEVNYSLEVLADDAKVTVQVAKNQLKATTDVSNTFDKKLEGLSQNTAESNTAFAQFVDDFALRQQAEKEFDDNKTTNLDKSISAAGGSGIGGDKQIISVIQETGLALSSLSIINKEISKALEDSGIDEDNPKEVERFKMTMMSDEKIRDSIVKELVESSKKIEKETVKKDLQEKYIQMGMSEAMATYKAHMRYEDETKKRQADAKEQIKIFKSLDASQRFQTSIVEKDYLKTMEAAAEGDQIIPAWAKKFLEESEKTNLLIAGWKGEWGKHGILTKILVVLALIAGIIVGVVVETIKKIINLFKIGGFLGGLFMKLRINLVKIGDFLVGLIMKLRNAVPLIDKIIKGIKSVIDGFRFIAKATANAGILMRVLMTMLGMLFPIVSIFRAFFMGMRLGAKAVGWITKAFSFLGPVLKWIGKIAGPIGILFTIIEAIIGAFKGFGKDGFSGIIPGIVAQLISSLTFGFVSFDTLYKFIKMLVDTIIYAVTLPYKLIWQMIKFVGQAFGLLWTLIVDIFSGKGIKASLQKFFGSFKEAIVGLLATIYDMTIKWLTGKLKMIGNMLLDAMTKVWNILKWANPFYIIYRGVEALAGYVTNLIEKFKDKILDFIPKIFRGITSLFSVVSDAIEEMKERALKWLRNLNPMNWFGGGDDNEETKSLDTVAKSISPTSTNAKSIDAGGGAAAGKETLMSAQKSLVSAQVENKNAGSTTINNNTAVNNNRVGGGKTPPPTIIAPQSPRNTEPTIRGMQFGEQPAF